MLSRAPIRHLVVSCLVAALVSASSMLGLAAPPQLPPGDITVTGSVTVNGQPAVSGTSIFTGSTVNTAQGSSAVVSLGKLGRVEVLPNSTARLSFGEDGVTVGLDAGRVRVSTPSGVNASVTTKDGTAAADATRADTFLVDVECGNTVVTTEAGSVELRSGEGTERVAAGDTDSIGRPQPDTKCAPGGGHPGGDSGGAGGGGLGAGRVLAVLVGVGGVIAALALVVSQSEDDDVNVPGPGNPSAIT